MLLWDEQTSSLLHESTALFIWLELVPFLQGGSVFKVFRNATQLIGAPREKLKNCRIGALQEEMPWIIRYQPFIFSAFIITSYMKINVFGNVVNKVRPILVVLYVEFILTSLKWSLHYYSIFRYFNCFHCFCISGMFNFVSYDNFVQYRAHISEAVLHFCQYKNCVFYYVRPNVMFCFFLFHCSLSS